MIQRQDYLESISCPVCHANDADVLFAISHESSTVLDILKVDAPASKVDIVACRHCGHRYMTPMVKGELMDRYYSILNSEFYQDAENVRNYNTKEYRDYTQLIKRLVPRGKILEIGCGNGFLLKTLEAAGYDCYGVEPSPQASDYAKNILGLKVENKFLADSTLYHQEFDVVILIDVVEHIVEMQSFMLGVKKVLKKGGFIFIGTGNINSMNARIAGKHWGYFLSWEHVSFFTKKSMRYLLKANNFTEIKIRTTSLQHKPVHNFVEFAKNLFKKIVNPFLKKKYYHGVTYDHFIVTAKNVKS